MSRSLFKQEWLAGAAALVFPVSGIAQVTTDVGRAPTLTIERYPEDWSYLADPDRRSGHWTERFKYVPINDDGSAYISTGVELRSRYEGYANVNWGSAQDDNYVWHRVMPYADLHVGNVRVFAQPILSAISGGFKPRREIDTTGVDMLQAFVEVEVAVGDSTAMRLSAGRKLVSLGAGRSIDTRYGPNVPQAFDGVEAVFAGKSRQLTAFYFRPVENGVGDFDDRTSRQKAIWGAHATQWMDPDKAVGVDAYYLGFRDRNAVFDQGAGRQVVHTFGSRTFGDTGAWFWNVEGAIQLGTFAGSRVAAWGIGGEFGHRFLSAPLLPEIALIADAISGDGDPKNPELGTLNPMFPRGKYFGALSPIGPRNLIHIHPSIAIHPRRDVAVSLEGVAFWRESTADGIYAIPGFIVRSGAGSDARFIGKQAELTIAWQATPELNLSASVSAFEPGPFIRDTGPAKTITMAGAMASFRF